MFKNQTILVTGGTGSWGYELVRQLLTLDPKEIRIISRNESSQFTMKQEFDNDPKLQFLIGDIKEKDSLIEACQGVDYVFHLAALKHVPVCEDQPLEALKTNVHGTQNVIDAAIICNVKRVIYISTDKAANPSNFYGLSKAMGERLIIHANTLNTKTKFVCIRGGNVLGTNGSVIHVFKKQIQEKGKVGITDLDMTRFFLTLEDAIKLVFKATFESLGGEIFVMKMPTCKIIDLAYVLIDASNKENVDIEILGIRPGEKIHELLLSEYESTTTIAYDEEYFVILPPIHIPGLKEHYANFKPVNLVNYNSSKELMTKEEIKEMLEKGRFI
ncbi:MULTISPECIES: polysaccharide biosynthesis protein [Priestia]|uniref:Polysaccharide biosynthesis protein n=1 Tax=Priestia flexa TaxID=86664 RepID=A0ABU4J3P5_9BACI|nr:MULTISPECIES: polysaccharide biosynthesis protein [Priestia]AQX54597.1 UDP-N-acetylglucosamine 4,6-dehydratase [Priestia flexa]MBY6085675.1 polysaccharide biosynthesis protein [Priestia flexa]MCA1201810.1 polysaccharide biosynthesis protein [Priestia flexa]MCG7313734.1 polysaccharide biosynthesis protein [Priestia flexa]MDW8515621.1 polysaccharide biosynthesis protein [Priestia flexa]